MGKYGNVVVLFSDSSKIMFPNVDDYSVDKDRKLLSVQINGHNQFVNFEHVKYIAVEDDINGEQA